MKHSQDNQMKDLETIFLKSGFQYIEAKSKEFFISGQKAEFDAIFQYENIVVLEEHTTSKEPKKHIPSKYQLYEKILSNKVDSIKSLYANFPELEEQLTNYDLKEIEIRIVYYSINPLSFDQKSKYPKIIFLTTQDATYFKQLANTIYKTARWEILNFLKVPGTKIGADGHVNSETFQSYPLLSSSADVSNFSLPENSQVVSLYMDPDFLLRQACVLRKDSWRASSTLYQRLIVPAKVNDIRKNPRFFLNNIVVLLSSKTRIEENEDSETYTAVLPKEPASIAIIDGQHRVYSFYENDKEPISLNKLRKKRGLLVTGIILPKDTSEAEQTSICASVFRQLNEKQTHIQPDLIQELQCLTEPLEFSSMANLIMGKLTTSGRLQNIQKNLGTVERYTLQPIISPKKGTRNKTKACMYSLWNDPEKILLTDSKAPLEDRIVVRNRYVDHCAKELNSFLDNIASHFAPKQWAERQKDGIGVLDTKTLGSFFLLFDLLIQEHGRVPRADDLDACVSNFSYQSYGSSAYRRIAKDLLGGIKNARLSP